MEDQCQGCVRAHGGSGPVSMCWKVGGELKPEDPCLREEGYDPETD